MATAATATSSSSGEKQARLGKRPVVLPSGVQFSVQETVGGREVTLKGPKGTYTRRLPPAVTVEQKDGALLVKAKPNTGTEGRMYQGTVRALLATMAKGVSEGFALALDLHGVGYRAEVKGNDLTFGLGFSHQVKMSLPQGIKARVETLDEGGQKRPRLHLESFNKELLGQFAARVRAERPPEPYKGKGVRYMGERVRQKAGKSAAKGKAGAK